MYYMDMLDFFPINDRVYDERIPMGEGNHVNFVQQFVEDVSFFSSQYGDSGIFSRLARNIIGLPDGLSYTGFDDSFAMKTYGPWWDKAPSRLIDYMPQNNTDVVSQDYIDITYREAIFPIRVSIYELRNPGSVIRIWAYDSINKWFLLWSGPPQVVSIPSIPRIFSPPLQPCNFSTNMLRLEFNHSLLNHYTELDAVLLIGTKQLIIPKDQSHKQNLTSLLKSFNDKYPCHENIHNLTPVYKNAHSDIVHLKRTLNEHCIMFERYYNLSILKLGLCNCYLINDEGFSYLENLEFLERLDLSRTCIKTRTLCKILQKNPRMRHLHIRYTCEVDVNEVAVELKNSCPDLESIDSCTNTFTSRGIDALADCKNLREVDFGWCGDKMGYGDNFRRLLSSCQYLEKIFLTYFKGLNEHDLETLTLCKNLKQLDLSGTPSLPETCHLFFVRCPNLELIDLSFCKNIADCTIKQWQQKYTHVAIKRDENTNDYESYSDEFSD
ncbi:PREDICTED: F-box/LRR-repeat protein 4-like [Wasmannia auropunctata]|uniref:F-box/LRR-repeat protein 4-like n=1 Tax=Wasmannia auropunctata TaxID=64793 RepID=UPI0005EF44C1|nr:PREDICTED: F-box/LRR-repeat protein 4-like [Wasmannia auropunctata]